MLSGGPASVYTEGAPALQPGLLALGVPVLGICYGMQAMAKTLGGEVARTGAAEYGKTALEVLRSDGLFRDLPADVCWMSHRDAVHSAPPGFVVTARTAETPVAAMEDRGRRLYGVQFHPEVTHTAFGTDLLKAFLFDVCDCSPTWTPVQLIEDQVARIRAQVGEERAICALSGGVDSAVAATLVSRAVGNSLTCIFVDHGFLREREAQDVIAAFRDVLHLNLIAVDASNRFLEALAGVSDPEEKRKIIGREFIAVFDEHARAIPGVDFLVQGTLYPDVIESKTPQSKSGAKIKTHHNVGGLPEHMALRLVEPLRLLFKDEVRALGRELGLPEAIVARQPFPGPGLAVRVIGAVTKERLAVLRRADAIAREEIVAAGAPEPWQYFAVLTPIQSVGVMGDGRSYDNIVALRAVTSEDGMTADWARLPYDVLQRISTRIVNEVPGVNRVVYDITSKPPATIEWE